MRTRRRSDRVMMILQMLAQGHHGYPQPEDDYYKSVYPAFCERCGIHGRQSAPFRLRRSRRALHSDFVQLNWVFDAWFVHPEVATELGGSGISGISIGPVIDHRSGKELVDRRQLLIGAVVSCVDTSRLPVVTCRPDNEESAWKIVAGQTRYDPSTPYCGAVKHHVRSSVAIRSDVPGDVPDLFQTAEWFGSGGAAHRLTLCTERFAALVKSRGWRGLEFRTVV
jgi:hypothetical protein